MNKYLLFLSLCICTLSTLGCQSSEVKEHASTADTRAVSVFPLDNKMMYKTEDAKVVEAIILSFDNKAPVLEKMLPKYTHRVIINRGELKSTWLFNKAGYVQEDIPNARIFKIRQPELVTALF